MSSRVPFVAASIDLFFVGGLSILVFVGFAAANAMHLISSNPFLLSSLAGTISWFINWPHFSATLHRLYGDKNSRAEFPHTVYLSPVIAICGFVAGVLSPLDFAPLWAKTFLLWSGYHFSAQSLGFSLLYARRDGVQLRFWEHRLFSLLCFAPFLFLNLIAETRVTDSTYFGVPLYSLKLPLIIRPWLENAMIAITLVFFFSLYFLRRRLGRWPHFLVLIPLISQFCWFWLTRDNPGFSEFVPAFHSLQYLLIAWYMNAFSFRQSPRQVWKKTGIWTVVNFAGGAFLFLLLPRFLSQTVFNGTLSRDFIFGMCLACVQVQHFFVDGVIWKLKYKKASEPLLQNWKSPVRALVILFVSVSLISFALFAPDVAQAKELQKRVEAQHAEQALADQRVILRTNFGDMELVLYPKVAPQHVARILRMADQGHINGMIFGRLEKNFVLQLNQLSLPAQMKNEYPPIKSELSDLPHVFGVLSMARQDGDVDSATTSFSIMLGTAKHLDRGYTVFGRVESGLDVLKAINDNVAGTTKIPKYPIVIKSAEVYDVKETSGPEAYQLHPVTVPSEAAQALQLDGVRGRAFETMSLWLLILSQVLFLLQFVRQIKVETKKYLHGLTGLTMSLGIFGICFELSDGPLNMSAKFLGFLGLILTLRALSGIESSTHEASNLTTDLK